TRTTWPPAGSASPETRSWTRRQLTDMTPGSGTPPSDATRLCQHGRHDHTAAAGTVALGRPPAVAPPDTRGAAARPAAPHRAGVGRPHPGLFRHPAVGTAAGRGPAPAHAAGRP